MTQDFDETGEVRTKGVCLAIQIQPFQFGNMLLQTVHFFPEWKSILRIKRANLRWIGSGFFVSFRFL